MSETHRGKIKLSSLFRMVPICMGPCLSTTNKHYNEILIDQVERYYPNMAPFLLPRIEYGSKYFSPPRRWEEPLVKPLIESYVKMMSIPDTQLGFNNSELASDPVYSSILNPDVKKTIADRSMPSKQYLLIDQHLKKVDEVPLLNQAASTSLAVRSTSLMTPEQTRMMLDNLPAPLLAIESQLSRSSVDRLKDKGIKGSQIVDLGFTIKNKQTSSESVQRIIAADIEDWDGLIDVAREMGVTVKFLIKIMKAFGPGNMEEMEGIVDRAGEAVAQYCDEHRWVHGKGWWLLMRIFSDEAEYDIAKAVDIMLNRRYSRDLSEDE